ncbi:MAG TPA: MFS transporter [Polyangia bacterium]|nr:MFS transporter [Polyangia bacterium]
MPRVVVWIGVVSFATDASTEMIYPLLPLFLSGLGAGAGFIGVVEGAAEAMASLLKLVSGRLADRARRKKPLTVFGYGVSSLVRPLTGLATHPWMVLLIRLTDRFGKGVRSSPRDALLADATSPEHRGRAYGFHHAMDNAGAVIGPAIASALLIWGKLSLSAIFLWSAVPGAVAMAALIFGVRERGSDEKSPAGEKVKSASLSDEKVKSVSPSAEKVKPVSLSPADADGERRLLRYLAVLGVFALGNSSDAFLLLRAKQLGVANWLIPFLWMVHNGTKAALGTLGGALSDRLGRRRLIIAGWAVYGAAYLGFGWADAAWQMWPLFVFYGLYYALTEGSEKALIADLAPASRRGRAFGLYYAVVGLIALPASLGFSALADRFGALPAFSVAAGLAAAASVLLATLIPEPSRPAKA